MATAQPTDESFGATPPRLNLRVSKSFGRVKVLDDVPLTIAPGEIHGLVGQNGSGKSTLIKVLSGFYPADEGSSVSTDGVALGLPLAPTDLQRRGLAFVHQDLGLDGSASVIENVRIGRFRASPIIRKIQWKTEAASVTKTLTSLGAGHVNPYALVSTLNHAERASVAIARAIQGLDLGMGCIVFDESTQSLPRDILHEFYARVRSIVASGTSVLIVSHRLDEVLALCDRVTVLEDGRATVEGHSTEGLTESALTKLILGRSAANRPVPTRTKRGDSVQQNIVLDVDSVTGGALRSASFSVRAGEIVGLIGTSDSGYDELPYLVAGVRPGTGGSVSIVGESIAVAKLSPARAIAAGLCLIPGNRSGEGLATELAAYENISLPRLTRKANPFALRRSWQISEFATAVSMMGLTPSAPDLSVTAFSGGNQQKILLSKWLMNEPQVLVLHEPTQAVDVGARADILGALLDQAARGVGIVISSIEAQDLASVCDRILVVKDGAIVSELTGTDLEPHVIIDSVYAGVSTEIAHVAA